MLCAYSLTTIDSYEQILCIQQTILPIYTLFTLILFLFILFNTSLSFKLSLNIHNIFLYHSLAFCLLSYAFHLHCISNVAKHEVLLLSDLIHFVLQMLCRYGLFIITSLTFWYHFIILSL